MKRPEMRHYTEEELLLHVLGEEDPEAGRGIDSHFEMCQECRAVFQEYEQFVSNLHSWKVPDLPEESWRAREHELMRRYREDGPRRRRKGVWDFVSGGTQKAWEYALANPLPALGYIIAAVAFASERTITVFHLDKVLPATTEVFRIIRQVL